MSGIGCSDLCQEVVQQNVTDQMLLKIFSWKVRSLMEVYVSFLQEEYDKSSSVQMSPVSLYAEASRSPVMSEQRDEKPGIHTHKSPEKQKKLPLVVPKPANPPKTLLIPAAADIRPAAGYAPKTIIFQPMAALAKQQPLLAVQQPSAGQQIVLAPSAVVELSACGIVAAQPVLTVNGRTAPVIAPSVNILPYTGCNHGNAAPRRPQPPFLASDTDANASLVRRQQRMIKNRESAFQSRRKKKEYMQGLELRLRAALLENDKLKKENGSLQRLLEDVVSENQKLKVTSSKKKAVCLMMVAIFLVMNFNPLSILESDSGSFDMEVRSGKLNRHLLEFSPSEMDTRDINAPQQSFRPRDVLSAEKALMVVNKEPLLYIPPPPPPCRPLVNQSESLRLNQELRGWVHRHEAERTKSRRTISTHKARAVEMADGKVDTAQLVTVQYTDTSIKNSNEVQIYYSSPRSYQDFLEAIHRRGDTFYVVSFRRDHLLLPATNRSKSTRPKMSIILPSTNVNENVIDGQEYEVMMQIDCEVMNTRILHVKSTSIPPFLREHGTKKNHSFYQPDSSDSDQARVLSATSEAAI
ncbi:cyclic AMP-dependent transcription factor ATF-6 alpha [Hyperolius riggenbachi]|uniref:cyclic AMP-dependent transcription factor ATF-6 alpha n=1 Tax=Hyperolius riggenbachi TaxID=752182 RepID=UPI0035A2BE01